MKELSMHILDIANNSIRAGATQMQIKVIEDVANNRFEFHVDDNGCGIEPKMLKNILNPFTTSRTLRKVGLGLSLLNDTCTLCEGHLDIQSEVGKGTKLIATMVYDHIDRPPMGDIVSSIAGLITSNEHCNIHYFHSYNDQSFDFSTDEIKEVLGDVSIKEPSIYVWMKGFIQENLDEIRGN